MHMARDTSRAKLKVIPAWYQHMHLIIMRTGEQTLSTAFRYYVTNKSNLVTRKSDDIDALCSVVTTIYQYYDCLPSEGALIRNIEEHKVPHVDEEPLFEKSSKKICCHYSNEAAEASYVFYTEEPWNTTLHYNQFWKRLVPAMPVHPVFISFEAFGEFYREAQHACRELQYIRTNIYLALRLRGGCSLPRELKEKIFWNAIYLRLWAIRRFWKTGSLIEI
jgi:hypothetical protein